ncbi:MAG: phosphonate transporter, partial [Hyphomicrobiales bacterium]|nr:phosphonate transporter [Hyphomicrobiales bacterium]
MLKKILLAAVALMALGANVYAAELKELRIGLLGGENEADRLRNYACVADDLKKAFNFDKVALFPAADYDGVIQGLLGG